MTCFASQLSDCLFISFFPPCRKTTSDICRCYNSVKKKESSSWSMSKLFFTRYYSLFMANIFSIKMSVTLKHIADRCTYFFWTRISIFNNMQNFLTTPWSRKSKDFISVFLYNFFTIIYNIRIYLC